MEDLDSYAMCAANLISLQKSNGASKGKYNINTGMRADDVVNGNTGEVISNPAGERLNVGLEFPAAIIAANSITTARTYTINLLSILGSLGNQYVPLFGMTSSPLRLELQLVASPAMFCNCDTVLPASFSLTNVEYIASFIDLSDSAMSIINQSLNGQPLQYVIPSYRNYVYNNTITNAVTTQISAPVPAKFSSLKHIICAMRSKSAGAITFFPLSSCHFGLSQYTIRLGSKVIPSKAPASIAEYFSEVCKCVASLSDLTHCPNMNMYSYNSPVSLADTETYNQVAGTTSLSSNFMIGVDMETYANADKESIFSGYNTNTDDIFWQFQFDGSQATTLVRFDFFALYDSLLICENGTAYVKY